MSRKSVLGRGLASLIPEASAAEGQETAVGILREVPLDQIDANHLQPRQRFNDERLEDLASSIREQGLLQPLVVVERPGGRYELIAGERRLRASRMLDLEKVPALVRRAGEEEMLELALIENIQRDQLNAIELARAFQQLQEQFGQSHEQIAQRVGKDRSTITNHLRLLSLPEVAQQAVVDSRITMGHARCLAALQTEAEAVEALDQVLSRGLTVRQTEQLVKARKAGASGQNRSAPPARDELPVEWRDVSRRLERAYATQVRLERRGGGGSLRLDFGSTEELNRILDRMLS